MVLVTVKLLVDCNKFTEIKKNVHQGFFYLLASNLYSLQLYTFYVFQKIHSVFGKPKPRFDSVVIRNIKQGQTKEQLIPIPK